MIKAVFFDFDGVLTREASGTASIVKYISRKTGIDEVQFNNEYRKFKPDLLLGKVTHEQIWDNLCDALNQKIPFQVLVDSFLNTELDHQIISLVRKIKAMGYKVGVITDNKIDRIKVISDLYKLDELFDMICVSAYQGLLKLGKEIFSEAAKNTGVYPSEAVFIDNNPENLIAPKELGMYVIHFDHDEREYAKLITQLDGVGVIIKG